MTATRYASRSVRAVDAARVIIFGEPDTPFCRATVGALLQVSTRDGSDITAVQQIRAEEFSHLPGYPTR